MYSYENLVNDVEFQFGKLERMILNIVDTGTYDYAQSLTEY